MVIEQERLREREPQGRILSQPIRLHSVFLAMNVSYAFILAVVSFTYSPNLFTKSAIYFLLPAERMFVKSAGVVNQLGGRERVDSSGREIIVLVGFLLIAGILFLLVRLFNARTVVHEVLHNAAGICAILLVPSLWLYVEQVTWMPGTLYTFWHSSEWWLFVLEGSVLVAFVVLANGVRMSLWWGVLIFSVHYLIWTALIEPWTLSLWSAKLLFLAFPLSGFTWLLHGQANRVRRLTHY